MSDEYKKQQELISQLKQICQELGWDMIVPTLEDGSTIAPGLILGNEEFCETVMAVLDAGPDDYEGFSTEGGEIVERENLSSKQKKRSTFH